MIRLLPVVILALAGGAAAQPFELEEVAATAGGPKVLLAPRAGARASLVVSFDVGSVDDGNRSGLVRLTQHAMLSANGQLDYPRFFLDLHASNGTLGIQTGPRQSAFFLDADASGFDELAVRLLGAVLTPRLDRARWRTAVARAMHDGRQPGAGTDLLSFVATTVIEDVRYQNEPYGDPDQIDLAEMGEARRLLGSRLSPANATVVVAGKFDRAAILKAVRRARGGTRADPAPPRLALPFTSRFSAPKEVNVLAYPMRIVGPRDAAAARLLEALAEGELWRRFRQAGVGYSFTVLPARSPWLDLFIVILPAHDPSSIDLAPHLKGAMEWVSGGALEESRFQAARTVALARLRALDERPDRLAATLAAGGPVWHGRDAAEALAALDPAAFFQAVSPWLAATNTIQLHFGPGEPR